MLRTCDLRFSLNVVVISTAICDPVLTYYVERSHTYVILGFFILFSPTEINWRQSRQLYCLHAIMDESLYLKNILVFTSMI